MKLFSFGDKKSPDNHNQKKQLLQTWQLIVHGRVQGVGFRWSVQMYAEELNLNGTVRNNTDGTVTIQLQTTKNQVDNFIKNLPNKISNFARIDHVEIKNLGKLPKMHDFHVLY